MRNFIALAAAVAINLALFAAFQRSAEEAVPVPNGEVTVTEFDLESVPTLAQVTTHQSAHAAL